MWVMRCGAGVVVERDPNPDAPDEDRGRAEAREPSWELCELRPLQSAR